MFACGMMREKKKGEYYKYTKISKTLLYRHAFVIVYKKQDVRS